jgi:hypothetical protein
MSGEKIFRNCAPCIKKENMVRAVKISTASLEEFLRVLMEGLKLNKRPKG